MRQFYLILISTILAACTAATPTSPPPLTPTPPPTTTPDDAPIAEATPTPEPTEQLADGDAVTPPPATEDEPKAEEAIVRPHRDAPAPLDEFVSDSPQFIGATGKPQMIEFFTFW